VRKAFNLAIRWGWRSDNPASGVHRNPEQKRDRYLSAAEMISLSQALATHPEKTSANAIRLLMLTGARRSEVLSATWDQFDLHTGVWTKPSAHTKQRKPHRVPLSAPAVQLLTEIRSGAESAWVFSNDDGEKPISDIKRTWLSICRTAGLAEQVEQRTRDGKVMRDAYGRSVQAWRTTVRIHDLRHTFASILASQGLSLPMIGALLGHTQAQTTHRYSHLFDDPLRAATEHVGALFQAASGAKGSVSSDIVPLRFKK
jgi:integrase